MKLQIAVAAAMVTLSLTAGAAERWRLQYFHDTDDQSRFYISTLRFVSPQRGIAAGTMARQKGREPYAVVTSDGGQTWTPLHIPDSPLDLCFAGPDAGWLLGERGLWFTSDFGATWKRRERPKQARRILFQDPNHGWAAGVKKTAYETNDGGVRWAPLAVAADPKTTPEYTTYTAIAASGSLVLITGASKPPRPGDSRRLPDWIEPESRPRELPSTSVLLQTSDGGKVWRSSEVSLFGRITRAAVSADGRVLMLVEFLDRFDYPSEVFGASGLKQPLGRVFRRKDRVVTDILLTPGGPAYLAATATLGSVPRSPIPQKLSIIKSSNLSDWYEMPVDYRAVAGRAVLASPGGNDVWAATDTGMVLRLVSE